MYIEFMFFFSLAPFKVDLIKNTTITSAIIQMATSLTIFFTLFGHLLHSELEFLEYPGSQEEHRTPL